MTLVKNPKNIAASIVSKVLDESLFINELLNNTIDSIPYTERRFITELVYGTIRHLTQIDFWIEKAMKKSISKVDTDILSILRISVYQMLFMSNRETRSVTHEATEIVKASDNKKAAGFVNFIMREIPRLKPSRAVIMSSVENNEDRFNTIYYSYPSWLYEIIKPMVSKKSLASFLELANTPLGITLRVEGGEREREKIIETLTSQGVTAEKAAISPFGIYTDRAVNYTMIKDFGNVFIQDESSQLAVMEMDILPGMDVLDLCAAPGGKTFFLSYLTGEKGKVIAADINRHKLQNINETMIKYGRKNIDIKLHDATVLRNEWKDKFCRVLVDAPCSSLGTIRRHPEVKWLRNKNDPDQMARLSGKILDTASNYVALDGILLFSVCTFTRRETTDQVQEFIKNKPNFKVEKAYYSVSKTNDKRDEFFITRFRRIK